MILLISTWTQSLSKGVTIIEHYFHFSLQQIILRKKINRNFLLQISRRYKNLYSVIFFMKMHFSDYNLQKYANQCTISNW